MFCSHVAKEYSANLNTNSTGQGQSGLEDFDVKLRKNLGAGLKKVIHAETSCKQLHRGCKK
jgi:hypothetical protein